MNYKKTLITGIMLTSISMGISADKGQWKVDGHIAKVIS